MHFARGKVTLLRTLGTDVSLAEIDWGNPELPRRLNVKNLTTVKGIALGE